MGNANSNLDKHLDALGHDERFFGLDNFGNTCYCNSVLQALYSCKRFREELFRYVDTIPTSLRQQHDGLIFALADLFQEISQHPRQHGNLAPQRFISAVRRADHRFRSYMHQDAQEFLNFTLDNLVETIVKLDAAVEALDAQESSSESGEGGNESSPRSSPSPFSSRSSKPKTFVHEIFCGHTMTHTRCMNCEGRSERQEQFLELTLEVQGVDTTIEHCMLAFSKKELLDADNKFHCESCNSYQEAQKWVDMRECPPVLVIHLNRLSFQHHLGREHKLKHRVVFGSEMSPPNMSNGSTAPLYQLFGVVAHVGTTAAHGHYISYVKRCGKWFCFDDDRVNLSSLDEVEDTFGKAAGDWSFGGGNDTHAYVLFYEAVQDAESGSSGDDLRLLGSRDQQRDAHNERLQISAP